MSGVRVDKNISFNFKMFSPLRTPDDLKKKMEKKKMQKKKKKTDSDLDSDVSTITKDIRKEVKSIQKKSASENFEDSDSSLFKTQVFPNRQSNKESSRKGHTMSSSDSSSSEESDIDIEELKREVKRKNLTNNFKIGITSNAKENLGKEMNNNGGTKSPKSILGDKRSPQTGGGVNNYGTSSGMKRKSSDSSDSELESDSVLPPSKKTKLSNTSKLSLSPLSGSLNGKKDAVKVNVSDISTSSDSDSDSGSSSERPLNASTGTVSTRVRSPKGKPKSPVVKSIVKDRVADISSSSSDSESSVSSVEKPGTRTRRSSGSSAMSDVISFKDVSLNMSASQNKRQSESGSSDEDIPAKETTTKQGGFQPPKGFGFIDVKERPIFNIKRLDGKQLFLIKAPAKLEDCEFGNQKIKMAGTSVLQDEKVNTHYNVDVHVSSTKEIQNLRSIGLSNDSYGEGYRTVTFGKPIAGHIVIKPKPPAMNAIQYEKQPHVKHEAVLTSREPLTPFGCKAPVRESCFDKIDIKPPKKKKNKKRSKDHHNSSLDTEEMEVSMVDNESNNQSMANTGEMDVYGNNEQELGVDLSAKKKKKNKKRSKDPNNSCADTDVSHFNNRNSNQSMENTGEMEVYGCNEQDFGVDLSAKKKKKKKKKESKEADVTGENNSDIEITGKKKKKSVKMENNVLEQEASSESQSETVVKMETDGLVENNYKSEKKKKKKKKDSV